MTSKGNGEAACCMVYIIRKKGKIYESTSHLLPQLGSCSKCDLFTELHWLTGCFITCIWYQIINAFFFFLILWASVSLSLVYSKTFRLRLVENNLLEYFVIIDICLLALLKMTAFISLPSFLNPQISYLIFSKCLFPLSVGGKSDV